MTFRISSPARLTSVLAGMAAAVVVAVPSAATATDYAPICDVSASPAAGAYVHFDVGLTSPNYWLANGAGFRIEAYASGTTYYGHGSGQVNGYIARSALDHSTCR